jgi:hypothetical protein
LSLDQVNSTRRSWLRGIYCRDISIAASPSRYRSGSIPQEDDIIDVAQGEGVCACDLSEDVAHVVQAEEFGRECLAASVDRQICHVVQIQTATYRGGRIINRSHGLGDSRVIVAVASVVTAEVVALAVVIVRLISVRVKSITVQASPTYPSDACVITTGGYRTIIDGRGRRGRDCGGTANRDRLYDARIYGHQRIIGCGGNQSTSDSRGRSQ